MQRSHLNDYCKTGFKWKINERGNVISWSFQGSERMGLGAMIQFFSLAFRHGESGRISFEHEKGLLLNQQSVVKVNNQSTIMFGRLITTLTTSETFTKQGAGEPVRGKAWAENIHPVLWAVSGQNPDPSVRISHSPSTLSFSWTNND